MTLLQYMSKVREQHSLTRCNMVAFISQLNGQHLLQGDVGNSYLEPYTNEKVYFIAGPEFGHLEGHTLIIIKALCGLCSSGVCFHDKLADALHHMGFTPSFSDQDVWMCAPALENQMYDYVVAYVDDLFVTMKHPEQFFEE